MHANKVLNKVKSDCTSSTLYRSYSESDMAMIICVLWCGKWLNTLSHFFFISSDDIEFPSKYKMKKQGKEKS